MKGRTGIIRDLILDHLALVFPECITLAALHRQLSSYRHGPTSSELNRHLTYLIQQGLVWPTMTFRCETPMTDWHGKVEKGMIKEMAITQKGVDYRKGSLSSEDGD